VPGAGFKQLARPAQHQTCFTQTRAHTRTHTDTYCTHTHAHAHTYTRTHKHTHTHTRTHTHTHTWPHHAPGHVAAGGRVGRQLDGRGGGLAQPHLGLHKTVAAGFNLPVEGHRLRLWGGCVVRRGVGGGVKQLLRSMDQTLAPSL